MYQANDLIALDTYRQRSDGRVAAEKDMRLRQLTKYKRSLQWTVLFSRLAARMASATRPNRTRTT